MGKRTQFTHLSNPIEAGIMFVVTRLNEMVTSLVLTKVDAFFVRQATRSHKPTGLHDSEEPSKSDVYTLKRYRKIYSTTARIALQNEFSQCSCHISSVTWACGGTAGCGLEGAMRKVHAIYGQCRT